jgi:predicted AlkP superfamily phosphohydrolase/phosphomutase
MLPSSWLGSLETHSRYGDIDFEKTRAFSDEMNYAATLHLNVAGRDPSGAVENRSKALSELKELLLSWREDGRPVVKKVWSREEAYEGDAVEWSPDLVLELHEVEGYTYTLLPSARVPKGCTWRKIEKEEHAGGKGKGMNGSHRQHGVLVLWGAGVRSGARIDAGMADCLPTLFALMGHPLPDWWEGRVLRKAVESVPVLWTEAERPEVASQAPLGTVAAAEVQARLESLGYL